MKTITCAFVLACCGILAGACSSAADAEHSPAPVEHAPPADSAEKPPVDENDLAPQMRKLCMDDCPPGYGCYLNRCVPVVGDGL